MKKSLCWLLILLIAFPLRLPSYADDVVMDAYEAEEVEAIAQSFYTDKEIKKPETDPLTWLGDLARRYNIFTNRGRMLKDAYDIDLAVGDPFTLREDTEAALARIPDRLRLNLLNFLSTNSAQIFGNPDPRGSGINPSGNALGGFDTDMNFILPQEMNSGLLSAIRSSIFNGALTDDQIVDFGVYLLSRAPFFPKTKEGWDSFKNKIYEYDIYLGIIVVAIMALFNQGSIGFTLFLFEGPYGSRIGAYTFVNRLGMSLSPEVKAGLKLKAKYLEIKSGFIKNFDDSRRTRLESEVIANIFADLSRKIGWDIRGSVRFEYTNSAADPSLQNTGNVTSNIYARTGKSVFEGSPYSLSILLGTGVSLDGKPIEKLSTILENQRTGFMISLNANYGPQAYSSINPGASQQNGYALGALAYWQRGAGIQKLIRDIEAEAFTIEEDLFEVERRKRDLKRLLENYNVRDERVEQGRLWLGLARVQLFGHLADYKSSLRLYREIRAESDPTLEPLDPLILKAAVFESRQPSYGAEDTQMNFKRLNSLAK